MVVLSLGERGGLLGEFPPHNQDHFQSAALNSPSKVPVTTLLSLGFESTFLHPSLRHWGWDPADLIFPLPDVRFANRCSGGGEPGGSLLGVVTLALPFTQSPQMAPVSSFFPNSQATISSCPRRMPSPAATAPPPSPWAGRTEPLTHGFPLLSS